MPLIAYKKQRAFSQDVQLVVDHAIAIISEYAAANIVLTLRMLYYQFVARNLFANTHRNYHRLSYIISEARLKGVIDWDYMIDRTRWLSDVDRYSNPQHALNDMVSRYAIDMWGRQEYRVEVWVEKDAIVGVVAPTCEQMAVPYFACRGFSSQSSMWQTARRLQYYQQLGQTPVILHFGDHDPSGIDMTRDIQDRLKVFMGDDAPEINRLALNWKQILKYKPPPNPVKPKDSRSPKYVQEFGQKCWELDALEPKTLIELIKTNILKYRNEEVWQEDVKSHLEQKAVLEDLSKRWPDYKAQEGKIKELEGEVSQYIGTIVNLTDKIALLETKAKKKPKRKK